MMKAYPKYKDSGIEWIGNIPAHWDVIHLKYCTDCFDGKRIPVEASKRIDGPYPYWGGGGIQSYVNDYLFDEELVLLGEDGAPFFDKQRPVAHYVTNKVWVNNHIHVLKARNNIEARFLTYALNSVDYSKYIEGSILSKLTQSDMNRIQIPLPPISEQQTVVGYLDDKSSKLDECVRLLELQKADLANYRNAIISQVVTRGLNPNAQFKDSGIEWIGQVPAEWKITRLKQITSKIGSGVTPKGGASVYTSNGILFIRSQNVYPDGLRLDNVVYISKEIDDRMQNSRIQYGDVLLNITGASIGRCATFDIKQTCANVNQHVCIIRPLSEKVISKYLQYVLNSNLGQQQIATKQTGGNREGLTFEQLKNFYIPDISLFEQQAIVDYLDTKTAKIDKTIANIDAQIADLRDYRSALISDVVTGKIDVRNAN